MTPITDIVNVSVVVKRNHPAATHSFNIWKQRWVEFGPVWEWYGTIGAYCHQHNVRRCRHPKA